MERLPSSGGVQPVEVYALHTGNLTHPERWIFEDGDPNLMQARQSYPDYSFLIRHPTGRNVLFDLGLAKDVNAIPEVIRGLFHITEPRVPQDASDILSAGPVRPGDVDAIILSHLHFDHVGDCTQFPHSQLIAGPGSRQANGDGWPVNSKSPFASAPVQHAKYHELSFERDVWRPLGPFKRAHDYFGDGTLFLIDTPGHMPGHLGALVLTGSDEWVFMGGDCCHHRSLLEGARPMSVTQGPAGQKSFHADPELAKQTIDKIRSLRRLGNVFVALAHDSFLDGAMPLYPRGLRGWSTSEWHKELATVLTQHYAS